MVERFNADAASDKWRPADMPGRLDVPASTEKDDSKKKQSVRMQAAESAQVHQKQEQRNPLFASGSLPEGSLDRTDRTERLPLLGEGIIWKTGEAPTNAAPNQLELEIATKDSDKKSKQERPGAHPKGSGDPASSSQEQAAPKPDHEVSPVAEEGDKQPKVQAESPAGPDKPSRTAEVVSAPGPASMESEAVDSGRAENKPSKDTAAEADGEKRDGSPAVEGRENPVVSGGPSPETDPEAESAYTYEPYEPDIESTSEQSGGQLPPPPVPPDFSGFFAGGHENPGRRLPEAYDPASPYWNDTETARTEPTTADMSKRYASDTPPGLQRTASDVSRAAASGAALGWWFGRRGKRAAVEQAHETGYKEGAAHASRQLEAQPAHDYPSAETGRPVIIPSSVETRTVESAMRVASVAMLERMRPGLRPEHMPHKAAMGVSSYALERSVSRSRVMETASSPTAERHDATVAEVAKMDTREMLKAAKAVKIEGGVSLKDIFDAKRIDENGMRHVLATYLRGGNYRERLSREITAKEMSFERDPLFRHNRRDAETDGKVGQAVEKITAVSKKGVERIQQAAGPRGAEATAAAQKQLKKAGAAVAGSARQVHDDLIDKGNTSDWFGVTAVVVVYSAILLLILTW